MAASIRQQLTDQLGQPAAAALAEFDDDSLEHLAAAIAAAREQQREELQRAAESSLAFVPRLLRGAVKRLVFG